VYPVGDSRSIITNIGEAAKASGVSAKMIRHYEGIGLVPKAARRDSNYRDYGAPDIHRLGFIHRSRALGFSVEQIRELLRLWEDKDRSSKDVKRLTLSHLAELDEKIALLEEMRVTLSRFAQACEGEHRPDYPIIEGLEGYFANNGIVSRT
jgi:Cu(I)-responsive transcriptional regulator